MPVPLLDVPAQNAPLAGDLRMAFDRVLGHGQFILGPEVEAFERAVADAMDGVHAIGVSSGTDALLLALMTLEIGPGDEVLCPAFTFFATAGAVARAGAIPVFVDVCPVCFNIDTEDARAKVTGRTRAIIPVHLFGQSADMDAVMRLAGDLDLAVIEDAAQAVGARHRGQVCGTIGTCGALSFFPSKNLGGLGDAGMLLTRDPDLAEKARRLRVHGSHPKYHHHLIGGNFRLDALQAALLGVKLPHLAGYSRARAANAADYLDKLSRLPRVATAPPAFCKCARAVEEWAATSDVRLILPTAYAHNDHTWNQFTIRLTNDGDRDRLKTHLTARGIGCEIYYPLTLDEQPCFARLPESSREGCHTAHALARGVLSLPVYPELTEAQRDEVVAAMAEFLESPPHA